MIEQVQKINWRLAPIRGGVLATFALIPVWHRLSAPPPGFTPLYATQFLIFLPMIWTIGWWLIMGLPGFHALRQDRRKLWAFALLLLALWAFASTSWAFIRADHPEVGENGALQFGVVALFAVAASCVGPSARTIVMIFGIGIAWNSTLTFLQVARQGPLGLTALGEFPIWPDHPGISVLMAGPIRWLRPYGLLPHPNILGGFLAIGLLAVLSGIFSTRWRIWLIGTVLFLSGFWALLLTFSRAAWGGFTAGILVALPYLIATRLRLSPVRRRVLATATAALMMAALFAALYWPLLAARAGVGEERVELRSVADRIVFTRFAEQAIAENTFLGVGIANFPWRTSYYLLETDYDLRGDNVHNIFLLAWAELGIVGLGLFIAAIAAGSYAAWQGLQTQQSGPENAMLFGAFAALAAIGLLDHYPWTLLHFQAAWWGCLAISLHQPQPQEQVAPPR